MAKDMTASGAALWRMRDYRAYMLATGFTTLAVSMQQLLTNVLFIDRLHASPTHVGFAQAAIGIPGLLLMLWGGANADRVDGRTLLYRTYAVMALPSLLLAVVCRYGTPSFATIVLWGLAMSACNSIASPALQAMLNRVCGEHVQKGVTTSTIIGFAVQICGLLLAGQVDRVGTDTVLLLQAAAVGAGALLITRVSAVPPRPVRAASTLIDIRAGFVEILRDGVMRDTMALNVVSTVFNAGAFMVVFPFLILRAYDGNPNFLAILMAVFFGGATLSNMGLLWFMPIRRLGRLFLTMQLSRIVILAGLWIQPGPILLVLFTFLWGVNMGITSTASRIIVQERADVAFRGRVLSVLNVGMLGAAPIAALLLGGLVEWLGPVDALLPGIAASVLIFAYGYRATEIWQSESTPPPATDASQGASVTQASASPPR